MTHSHLGGYYMNAFSHFVTKRKWLIISISLLFLIPSIIGYKGTKINYDLVSYLPKDVETMKGQNILTKDFKILKSIEVIACLKSSSALVLIS